MGKYARLKDRTAIYNIIIFALAKDVLQNSFSNITCSALKFSLILSAQIIVSNDGKMFCSFLRKVLKINFM